MNQSKKEVRNLFIVCLFVCFSICTFQHCINGFKFQSRRHFHFRSDPSPGTRFLKISAKVSFVTEMRMERLLVKGTMRALVFNVTILQQEVVIQGMLRSLIFFRKIGFKL
ncbi:hypothetical protein U1Q18_026776 [Sarracenia purpurea var. burkii]